MIPEALFIRRRKLKRGRGHTHLGAYEMQGFRQDMSTLVFAAGGDPAKNDTKYLCTTSRGGTTCQEQMK